MWRLFTNPRQSPRTWNSLARAISMYFYTKRTEDFLENHSEINLTPKICLILNLACKQWHRKGSKWLRCRYKQWWILLVFSSKCDEMKPFFSCRGIFLFFLPWRGFALVENHNLWRVCMCGLILSKARRQKAPLKSADDVVLLRRAFLKEFLRQFNLSIIGSFHIDEERFTMWMRCCCQDPFACVLFLSSRIFCASPLRYRRQRKKNVEFDLILKANTFPQTNPQYYYMNNIYGFDGESTTLHTLVPWYPNKIIFFRGKTALMVSSSCFKNKQTSL